jgi:hypothetical protein
MVFVPDMHEWLNIQNSINVIYHINRTKDKSHIIISIDAKTFHKVKHLFTLKTPNKLRIGEICHSIIKVIYKKPRGNNLHNSLKNLDTFLLRFGTRHQCPPSPLLFNIRLEVPTRKIRPKKEMLFKLERKK